jgi:DnaJ-domain-containing protein 1
MTARRDSRQSHAKTLYELLRVRAGDDTETLQSAFRNAAKASHPDLNPGDPDAARRVNTAYAILRNAKRRAAYDRLLALERTRRRAQLRRTIVSNVALVVTVTFGVVGGYALFVQAKNSVEVAMVVKVAGRKLADVTGVQSTTWARIASRDQLPNLPEIAVAPRPVASRMSGNPPVIVDGRRAETRVVEQVAQTDRLGEPRGEAVHRGPAEAPLGPSAIAAAAKTDAPLIIANIDPVPGSIADRRDAKDSIEDHKRAEDHKSKEGFDSTGQNETLSVDPRSSSSEKNTGLVRSSSTGTGDKLRVLAKRPATSRTSIRQAAVEGTGVSQVALLNRNPSGLCRFLFKPPTASFWGWLLVPA